MHFSFISRIFLGLGISLGGVSAAWAVGSPPLITDDPGTPGNGHWEINVGFSTDHRPGERVTEAPLLDLNYGIGETWQLKYEIPYLVQNVDEERVSGFGNSAIGVKWRFLDTGEKGWAASIYPQLEFNNPGSSSDARGLAKSGTAFLLPIQIERDLGGVILNFQLGRECHHDGDSWFYGVAVTRLLSDKVDLAVELAGSAKSSFDRSALTVNVGLVVDVNEQMSFMVSAGRELHNHAEPRATFVGYIGWQLRLWAGVQLKGISGAVHLRARLRC